MSMLVRKGTMLHRAGSTRRFSRRYSTAARGRERAASLAPSSSSAGRTTPRQSTAGLAPATLAAPAPEPESRRSSNTVSQISIDDRKRLYDDVESGGGGGGGSGGATYGSIVYQMRDASDEASGCVDFVGRALRILASSVLATVSLVIFATLPLLMVIMGVKYLRSCPREPHVPVYLLVGGCFGSLRLLLLFWRQSRSRRHLDHFEESLLLSPHHGEIAGAVMCARVMETLLSLFLLGWFAAGNYWTLSIYEPKFEPRPLAPKDWCDRIVYRFALGQIGVVYAIGAGFLVFACCLGFGYWLTTPH